MTPHSGRVPVSHVFPSHTLFSAAAVFEKYIRMNKMASELHSDKQREHK